MLKNKYLHNFLMFLGFLYFSLIPSYAYWEEELRQQREHLILKQQEAQQEKEKYIKELEQKRAEEVQRYKLLSNNMKISSPPIPQSKKEEYRKILKQANCIAYNSIQAAELALKGNFEISKNILTNLEIMTDKAKAGFDDKTSIDCPGNIEFNIPEPKMSIDQDSVYKSYQEITQLVSILIPEIQANNEASKIIQDKKQRLQKETEQLENELKDLQKKIKTTKNPKKKRDYKLLEEEAKMLLQQVELNYQIVSKKEEILSEEKLEIENKLDDLKKQLEMNK